MARSVTRTNLDIPSELHKLLTAEARACGLSLTRLILDMLMRDIEEFGLTSGNKGGPKGGSDG